MGILSDKIRQTLEELAPSSGLETLTTQNLFNEIELTEEETVEALRRAREEKYYRIAREQYSEKLRSVPVVKCTALDYWNALLSTQSATGKPYKIVKDKKEDGDKIKKGNWDVVRMLCLYFAKDQRFETEYKGMSLQKGIFLSGNIGCGKSHLMSFFMQNPNACYTMVSCRDIVTQWLEYNKSRNEDDNPLTKYSSLFKVAIGSNHFRQQEIGFCFDDLGTEEHPAKSYGSSINLMAHIILDRYDKKLPANKTHIVTNMPVKDIEQQEHYGTRFRDRMRETMNYISFPNDFKSFR